MHPNRGLRTFNSPSGGPVLERCQKRFRGESPPSVGGVYNSVVSVPTFLGFILNCFSILTVCVYFTRFLTLFIIVNIVTIQLRAAGFDGPFNISSGTMSN